MHMEPYLLNGDVQAPVARCRARCWSGRGCRQVALFANTNVLRDALQPLLEQHGVLLILQITLQNWPPGSMN